MDPEIFSKATVGCVFRFPADVACRMIWIKFETNRAINLSNGHAVPINAQTIVVPLRLWPRDDHFRRTSDPEIFANGSTGRLFYLRTDVREEFPWARISETEARNLATGVLQTFPRDTPVRFIEIVTNHKWHFAEVVADQIAARSAGVTVLQPFGQAPQGTVFYFNGDLVRSNLWIKTGVSSARYGQTAHVATILPNTLVIPAR